MINASIHVDLSLHPICIYICMFLNEERDLFFNTVWFMNAGLYSVV